MTTHVSLISTTGFKAGLAARYVFDLRRSTIHRADFEVTLWQLHRDRYDPKESQPASARLPAAACSGSAIGHCYRHVDRSAIPPVAFAKRQRTSRNTPGSPFRFRSGSSLVVSARRQWKLKSADGTINHLCGERGACSGKACFSTAISYLTTWTSFRSGRTAASVAADLHIQKSKPCFSLR